MKKIVLLILLLSASLTSICQTQKFKSTGINSLLKSYDDTQKKSLKNAFVLDEIINYYIDKKQLDSARIYLKQYDILSSNLKSKELSNRFTYRNEKVKYLASNKKILDTLIFAELHQYFKTKKTIVSYDISYIMTKYLGGEKGFGASWLKDKNQLIKWYNIAGKESYNFKEFDSSASHYYNASINLHLDDYKRIESAVYKGLQSLQKIGDARNLKKLFYTRLAESYFHNNKSQKILKLEKELKLLKNEKIINEFYGVASYYGEYFLTQKGKDEKAKKIKEKVIDNYKKISLPIGEYSLVDYDSNNNPIKKHLIVTTNSLKISTIKNDTITKERKYQVFRDFPIDKEKSILSVKLSENETDTWNFITFMNHKKNLFINESLEWENSESKQDSLLYEFITKKDYNKLEKQFKPRVNNYYPQKTFDSLSKLPIIDSLGIIKVKELFFKHFKNSDAKNEYAYFVEFSNDHYEKQKLDSLKIILRNIFIEQQFNPFLSFPVYINQETKKLPKPESNGDNTGVLYYAFILLVFSFIGNKWSMTGIIVSALFFISLNIYRKRKNKKSAKQLESLKDETQRPKTKQFLNGLIVFLSVLGFVIIGGVLGFFGGLGLGKMAGFTGGNSIGSIVYGIIGLPIGSTIGFILGLIISVTKKKS
tara:strand:- start:16046 stop:17995 length:1950 start_codon:yes stop_codon:yes gene_type:complete